MRRLTASASGFAETYDRRFPGVGENQDRVEEATIEVLVRNASDLPVDVARLAYEVRTTWMNRRPSRPRACPHRHPWKWMRSAISGQFPCATK